MQRHNLYACPAGAYFCSCKSRQNTVKGDRFPLDEPLSVACSAGYERCRSIVRTAHRYAPKVAAGASAPSPSPSPVAGEGPSGQIAAYSNFGLGSVTSCGALLGQSAALAALRCPKKSSRCSLARFFRPLRMLRLAASATGGARLRIPIHRAPLTPPNSHNKSQCYFPSKIHHLCDLRPVFPHIVNFPLKKVKY